MASSPTLSAKPLPLDPNIDLASAFKQIEADRQNQVGDVTKFGQTQDSNLQNAYGQLQQGIQSGKTAQQANYAGAAANIGSAYDTAGANNAAASGKTQLNLASMAQRMGLDPAALQSVQGDLAKQQNAFDLRNASSKADRMSSMTELGAKMSAVAQLGIQSAQQAEAQGRKDLSTRIQTEMQRIQTSAAKAQNDFTGIKTQQLQKQIIASQTQMMSIAKQLASSQRSAANAQRSANNQGNSDRNFQLAMAKFQNTQAGQAVNPDGSRMNPLQQAAAMRDYNNQHPNSTGAQQGYSSLYKSAQQDLGGAGRQMLDNLLTGKFTEKQAQDSVKNTYWQGNSGGKGVSGNVNDILSIYSQLMNMKRSGG